MDTITDNRNRYYAALEAVASLARMLPECSDDPARLRVLSEMVAERLETLDAAQERYLGYRPA